MSKKIIIDEFARVKLKWNEESLGRALDIREKLMDGEQW